MWRVPSKSILLSLLAALAAGAPVLAAPVPDLYVGQVPTTALSGPGLDEAFGLALDQVLVKITGQRFLAADPARRGALGPVGPLVRRYQPGPGGQVRVSFDPGALRRRLDAANLPVWADDRPRTLVILPADSTAAPTPTADPVRSSRQLLLATAASRGLPVVLANDPVAGERGATDPLLDPEARARAAGADLLLVGRRAPVGGPSVLRWTLAQGGTRAEWQGDVADGIHGLADRLAARYATVASAGRVLRVRIDGVDSFDAYGRLQSYLRGVGVIQGVELQQVTGESLFFELAVRGDVSQLNDAFALQRVLEPVADSGAGGLVYRLANGAGPDGPGAP